MKEHFRYLLLYAGIMSLFITGCRSSRELVPTLVPEPTTLSSPTPMVLNTPVRVSDLHGLKPQSIVATMDAVCPSIKPLLIDKFIAGTKIKGPVMLFPQKGEAWMDFYNQIWQERGVFDPLDHAGYVGIEVFSFIEVVIPPKIIVHDNFTSKGYDYEWIPEGEMYRFATDDDMQFYGACIRHKIGP